MNQILDVDDNYGKKEKVKKSKAPKMPKTRNSGPLEIQSIVKFFAIAILIFGVALIGTGSYSMYKGATKEVAKTKPVIYVEQTGEEEILSKVTHDKELAKITYDWNEEGATEVPVNNQKQVETSITIPTGTNTLRVCASDRNGQEIEYEKVYTVESDININLEPEGNNIKVIEGNQIEETIEIPKGLHKLTIIVVDVNNQTETKEQEVNGVTKPKLDVTTDGKDFIINASDEQGLTRVEFIINQVDRFMIDLKAELSLEDRKQFEYAYPLNDGENKLEVTIYNESGISETFRAMFNKE